MLTLFYWLIDIKGYKKWAFFFVVIGMNSIAIYFSQVFVGYQDIANYFTRGIIKYATGIEPLITYVSVIMVKWLVLWFLYKHRIFFKV